MAYDGIDGSTLRNGEEYKHELPAFQQWPRIPAPRFLARLLPHRAFLHSVKMTASRIAQPLFPVMKPNARQLVARLWLHFPATFSTSQAKATCQGEVSASR